MLATATTSKTTKSGEKVIMNKQQQQQQQQQMRSVLQQQQMFQSLQRQQQESLLKQKGVKEENVDDDDVVSHPRGGEPQVPKKAQQHQQDGGNDQLNETSSLSESSSSSFGATAAAAAASGHKKNNSPAAAAAAGKTMGTTNMNHAKPLPLMMNKQQQQQPQLPTTKTTAVAATAIATKPSNNPAVAGALDESKKSKSPVKANNSPMDGGEESDGSDGSHEDMANGGDRKSLPQLPHVSSLNIREKQMLPKDFSPSDCDVVCGRGKAYREWPGNERFRKMIEDRLEDYSNAKGRYEKGIIIREIVDQVRANCGTFPSCEDDEELNSSGKNVKIVTGGFVKQDASGRWYEVGDFLAREKTSQHFRDCLHFRYSSSNNAKKRRRQMEARMVHEAHCGEINNSHDGHENGDPDLAGMPIAGMTKMGAQKGWSDKNNKRPGSGHDTSSNDDPRRPRDSRGADMEDHDDDFDDEEDEYGDAKESAVAVRAVRSSDVASGRPPNDKKQRVLDPFQQQQQRPVSKSFEAQAIAAAQKQQQQQHNLAAVAAAQAQQQQLKSRIFAARGMHLPAGAGGPGGLPPELERRLLEQLAAQNGMGPQGGGISAEMLANAGMAQQQQQRNAFQAALQQQQQQQNQPMQHQGDALNDIRQRRDDILRRLQQQQQHWFAGGGGPVGHMMGPGVGVGAGGPANLLNPNVGARLGAPNNNLNNNSGQGGSNRGSPLNAAAAAAQQQQQRDANGAPVVSATGSERSHAEHDVVSALQRLAGTGPSPQAGAAPTVTGSSSIAVDAAAGAATGGSGSATATRGSLTYPQDKPSTDSANIQTGARPDNPTSFGPSRSEVIVCALQPKLRQKDESPLDVCKRVLDQMEEIRRTREVDLFVLPELSPVGYSEDTFARCLPKSELMKKMYELIDEAFAERARKLRCYICYGTVGWMTTSEDGDEGFTIRQKVVDRSGAVVAIYDKSHLCDYGACAETRFFKAGPKQPVSFTIDNSFRFGLLICADVRFPELSRTLARDHKVDVLLQPAAFARDISFRTWKSFRETRAVENSVYFIGVNYAGRMFGETNIIPPWVDDDHESEELGIEEGFLIGRIQRLELDLARTALPYHKELMNDTSSSTKD